MVCIDLTFSIISREGEKRERGEERREERGEERREERGEERRGGE